MKKNFYYLFLNILIFWVTSDIFTGINVNDGIVGYIICGGIFGLSMIFVVPLIKFFTLPVKFITSFTTSVALSIFSFLFMNFGVPFIDFRDGIISGFQNRYFELPIVELNMFGNIFVGGTVAGVLSALLRLFEKVSRSE